MKIVKSLILGFFLVVAVSGDEGEASAAGKTEENALISIAKTVFGLPFTIPETIIDVGVSIVGQIVNVVDPIVKTIKEILKIVGGTTLDIALNINADIIELLTAVGRTAINMVKNLLTFFWNNENKISAATTNFLKELGKAILKLINSILKLPIINRFPKIIKSVTNFIHEHLQTDIDDLKSFITDHYVERKSTYEPILNAISSRVLILTNAFGALITGELSACAGTTNPKKPANSLFLKLDIWLNTGVSHLFRFVGLKDEADKVDMKIEVLEDFLMPGVQAPPPFGTLNGN